jgi:outer membrane lipase/esterase
MIMFNLKKSIMLCCLGSVYAYTPQQLVFFGDSLTDTGAFGSPWVSQHDGQMYPQYLSGLYQLGAVQHFSSGGHVSQSNNSVNFAHGGAVSISSEGSHIDLDSGLQILDLNGQIDAYFAQKPQNQSHTLHVVWTGGNDLPAALSNPNTAQSSASNFAQGLASQVRRLVHNGAQLIIVPNVPDLALTPDAPKLMLSNMIHSGAIDGAQASILEQQLKHILASSANPQERDQSILKMLGHIDPGLAIAYQEGIDQLKKLTNFYNAEVNLALQGTQANIIRIDVNGLLKDVMQQPEAYGFSQVTEGVCVSAISCHLSTPNTTHLFADGRHPDSLAHQMVAQLMYQILAAPQAVSKLTRQVHQQTDRTLTAISNRPKYAGKLKEGQAAWFAEGSFDPKGHNPWGMFGLEYQPLERWLLGVGLARGTSKLSDALGHVRNNQWDLGLYAAWQPTSSWRVQSSVVGSLADLESTRAGIVKNRDVHGTTRGRAIGIDLRVGHLSSYRSITFEPSLAIGHVRSWVSGFADKTNQTMENFSGLSFEKQQVHTNYGEAGLRAAYDAGLLRPFLELGYRKVWGGEIKIKASTQGHSFTDYARVDQKSGAKMAVGVQTLPTSWGTWHAVFEKSKERQGVRLGLSHQF